MQGEINCSGFKSTRAPSCYSRPPRHIDCRRQFMGFFQESYLSPTAVREGSKQGRVVHCVQDGQHEVKFLATIV